MFYIIIIIIIVLLVGSVIVFSICCIIQNKKRKEKIKQFNVNNLGLIVNDSLNPEKTVSGNINLKLNIYN